MTWEWEARSNRRMDIREKAQGYLLLIFVARGILSHQFGLKNIKFFHLLNHEKKFNFSFFLAGHSHITINWKVKKKKKKSKNENDHVNRSFNKWCLDELILHRQTYNVQMKKRHFNLLRNRMISKSVIIVPLCW